RCVAVGIVLVGLALIGGIVVLIVGGGDDNNQSAASPQVANLQDQLLQRTVVNPDAGISIRRPGNWIDTKRNGTISIRSHDRCLVVSLSAPTSKDDADTVRRQGVSYYKDNYKNVKVQGAPDSKLGGIPTTTNTVTFGVNGHRVAALVSVGKGNRNAYVTQVVVRNPSCQGDLQLAQLMLGTAQFTK